MRVKDKVIKRLLGEPDRELRELIGIMVEGRGPMFSGGMREHFRIAKEKKGKYAAFGQALGISVGGSNIKLMLAHTEKGAIVADHVRAQPNPDKMMHFYEFLDSFFLGDSCINRYITSCERPVIGFSIPTGMYNGTPYNPTKVPTIDGLIARTVQEIPRPMLRLEDNLKRYLRVRGFPEATLFCQSDGIVAHHGAVASSEVSPSDKTVLLVCGTGIATSDEESYIQAGIIPYMTEDEELYPAGETEHYQINYAAAGKGLFRLMHRAIRLCADEADSALAGAGAEQFFTKPSDSRRVTEIWASSLPGGAASKIAIQVKKGVGAAAYEVLKELAGAIVMRSISLMANCTAATIINTEAQLGERVNAVYFEGSMASRPEIVPILRHRIVRAMGSEDIYSPNGPGFAMAAQLEFVDKFWPIDNSSRLTEENKKEVDLTLIGSVSMAIAAACRDVNSRTQ